VGLTLAQDEAISAHEARVGSALPFLAHAVRASA
jgi:hypothetical protein